LHLHMVIWVHKAPSPQVIRDKLTSKDSVFTRKLIAYLESCHQGEFNRGDMPTVSSKVPADPTKEDIMSGKPLDYVPPTHTFPEVPPPMCNTPDCGGLCDNCTELTDWWGKFEDTVDDILLRSNHHIYQRRGCINKDGMCKARFPREIHKESTVDDDGHVNIKQLEANLNTTNRIMTFFSRSNTDCTSMLSGTAVKAVISYVTDYISKLGLKSYQAFASVFDVFKR
ncbi:hypothetical protein C8R46DRAFT_844319, partial [Mycena filopes]